MNDAERLIEEIRQMREQYAAEVGEGRRAWPKSIKERVFALGDLGMRPKKITAATGVPYETVCQWRYQRNQHLKKFHNLTVTVPAKQLVEKSSPATATVTEKVAAENLTVTVTTPDGFLIEGLPAHMVVEILKARGPHAL
jgi:hypothetical protein